MTQVKRPRLLDSSSFQETARLEPEQMSLTLQLRDTSYAKMTIPDAAPAVNMHDWMELFTAKGSAGLFRVTRMEATSKHERALTLMHAIDTLSDDVWGEQTDFDGYVNTFLAALLAKQKTTRWQLGTCADTSAYKRAGINYTRLSDLLAELLEAKPDYYLTFDFSTSPWTVNLAALPADISAEFRLTRNVETAQVTRDDAEMCNRLYLSINSEIKGTPQSFATRDFTDYRTGYYLNAQAAETAGTGWTIKRYAFASATKFKLAELTVNASSTAPLALAYQRSGMNYPLGASDVGHTFEADALLINYSTANTASAIENVSIIIPDANGDVKTTAEEIRTYNNSTSQALYGIIEKTADIDLANVASPDAWAQQFLADRAGPAVQITIDGWELGKLTGDTWDEYDRGRKVRATLNDMGEIVTERVESVTYPDVLGAPEKITVEMANKLARYSAAIAKLQKESKAGGRASRGLSRSSASATSMEHWAMIVQKIEEAQKDTGIAQLWESGIELDAQAGVRIYSLYQGFESNYSAIQVNNQKIALVVQNGQSGYEVNTASIVLAINDQGSTAHINAEKIYLTGQTSIEDLLTGQARVAALDVNTGSFVQGNFESFYAEYGIHVGQGTNNYATWQSQTVVTGVTVSGGMVDDVQSTTIYYLGR